MADRFDEAIDALQDATETFRITGDRNLEGDALCKLGTTFWLAQRSDEAIAAFQAAITIFGELGDQHSERMTLKTLKKLLEGHG
jgi:hypothetical protein